MFLITIDGPAGSGKTSLASLIHDHLTNTGESVAAIHMDDLYNGWEDPLSLALTSKIENIIKEAKSQPTITIPQFDWVKNDFAQPLTIPTPQTLILEGVGSGQACTRPHVSISIWIEAPRDVGFQRVLDRDGIDLLHQMQIWQRIESEHFSRESTKSAADYQVKSAP